MSVNNPLDPHVTLPRSLEDSSREQLRQDRPQLDQGHLKAEDLKERARSETRTPETEETEQKILKHREREKADTGDQQQEVGEEGEEEEKKQGDKLKSQDARGQHVDLKI